MEFFSDFFFLILFVASYVFRNDGGIPLPIQEFSEENKICWKRLPMWDFLIGDGTPETLTNIFIKNFSLWGFFYSLFHILTHIKPQRKLFHPFKFNPNYPSLSMVMKEILRSMRGVLICSIYEVLINQQHVRKNFPLFQLPDILQLTRSSEKPDHLHLNGVGLLTSLLFAFAWGDFHFYWTHRMLHTKWLYRNVHKVHHESFNPDPFSGAPKLFQLRI